MIPRELGIMPKGQVETSVIVGIIVVLAIVSAVGFSVYYFGFVQPRRKQLQNSKDSTISTLEQTLGSVDTNQAQQASASYKAKIETAGSKSEVSSLASEVASIYQRESTREELLSSIVKDGTHGSFYTLSNLYDALRNQVNSKSTLSQLESLRSELESEMTQAWIDLHEEAIGNILENDLVRIEKDSPAEEAYISKENALKSLQEQSWETLQKTKFMEKNTFKVPIVDTFQRVPTLKPGDKVDIYEYNSGKDRMTRRVVNTEVLDVIYPVDTISSISWTKSVGKQSYSYSTDVWREIKASEAGSGDAKSSWSDWAQTVVDIAREEANIGSYDLQAIYVVEITNDNIAKTLMQIEEFQSDANDVVLIARK